MTPAMKTRTMIMISRKYPAATALGRDEPTRLPARLAPPRSACLLPSGAVMTTLTAFAIRRIASRDAKSTRHRAPSAAIRPAAVEQSP
jgi:hypothetical protein